MKDFKKSMPKLIGLMLGIAVLLGIIGLSATADNVSADQSNVSSDISTAMSAETTGTEEFSAVPQEETLPPSADSSSTTSVENGSNLTTGEDVTSEETSSEVVEEPDLYADALADGATSMTKAQFLDSLTTYNFAVLPDGTGTVYSGQSAKAVITLALTAGASENSVVAPGQIVGRVEMPKYSVYNSEFSSNLLMGKDYNELKASYEAKRPGDTAPFTASDAAFKNLDTGKNYIFFVNWSALEAGNMTEGGFTLTPAPNGVSGTDLTSDFKSSFFYDGDEVTKADTDAIKAKYPSDAKRQYNFDSKYVSTAQAIASTFVATMNRGTINTDMNSDYKYADFTMTLSAAPTTAATMGRLYEGEYIVEQTVTMPKDSSGNLMLLLKKDDLVFTANAAGTTGKIESVVTENVSGTDYVSSFKVTLNQVNTSNPKAQINSLSGYVTFKNVEVNMATYNSASAWAPYIQIATDASGYKATTKSIEPDQGTKLADVTKTSTTGSYTKLTFSVTPPANENASANIKTYLQSVTNSPVANTAYPGTYPVFYTNSFTNKQNRPLETMSETYTWDNGLAPKIFNIGSLSWSGGSAVTYEAIATMADGTTQTIVPSKTTLATATYTPNSTVYFDSIFSKTEIGNIKNIVVNYKNVPANASITSANAITYDIVSAASESTQLKQNVALSYQYKPSPTSATTVGGTANSSAFVTYIGKDFADDDSQAGKDKGVNKSAVNESTGAVGKASEGDVMRYTLTIKNSSSKTWYDLKVLDVYSEYLEPVPASSGGYIGDTKITNGGNAGLTINSVTNDATGRQLQTILSGGMAPGTTVTITYRMNVIKDTQGKPINNSFKAYVKLSGTGGGGDEYVLVENGSWSGSSTASTAVEQPIKVGYAFTDFRAKDGVTASSASTLSDGHTFKATATIQGGRTSNINLTIGAISQWAPEGYEVQSISYQTSAMASATTVPVTNWNSESRGTSTLPGTLLSVSIPDFKISSSSDSITFTYSYKVNSTNYPWATVAANANATTAIKSFGYFKENSTIKATAISSGYSIDGPTKNLSTNAPLYYLSNGALTQFVGPSANVTILRTGAKGNITATSSPTDTSAAAQGKVSGTITSSGTEALKFNSFVFKLPESMTYTTGSVAISGFEVVNSDGTVTTLNASNLNVTVKDRIKDTNTGLYTSGQVLIITDSANRVMQLPGITGAANISAKIEVQTDIDKDYVNYLLFYDESKINATENGLVGIYLNDSDTALGANNTGNGSIVNDTEDLNGNGSTAERILVSKTVNLKRTIATTAPALDITPYTINGSGTWAAITTSNAATVLPLSNIGWEVKVRALANYSPLVNPTIVIKVPSNLILNTDGTGFKGGTVPAELSAPQVSAPDASGYTYITYTLNKTIAANSNYTISFVSQIANNSYGGTSLEAYLLPTETNPFLQTVAQANKNSNTTAATPLWGSPSSLVGWATDTTVTTGGSAISTSVNPTNNLTHMLYTRKVVEVYGFTGASTALAETVGSKSVDSSMGENLISVSDKNAVIGYTITAKNNGDSTFQDMMIVDRLPVANDRYVVASNSNRGSNNGATLYNGGNFVVSTQSNTGTNTKVLQKDTDYVIQYATVTNLDSFSNTGDWSETEAQEAGRWSNTASSDSNAFRVFLTNGSLAAHTNLIVTFETQWDTDTIKAGDIVYNSFGFAGTSVLGDYKVPFKVEPFKQGVQLISNGNVVINKTLLDSSANPNREFAFDIYYAGELIIADDVKVTVSKVNDSTGYTYAGSTTVSDLYLPEGLTASSLTLVETTTGYDTTIALGKYEPLNGVQTWTFNVVNKASYKLTYDGNGNTGGTVPSDTNQYVHGTSATVSAGTPTKTGATFLGWTLASDGTGTVLNSGDTVSMNGDTTLYAKWEFNDYNVIYNANVNASLIVGTVNSTVAYHYGDPVTVATPSFTVKGKTFKYWSTEPTASATAVNYTPGQSFTMQGNDVTLYAHYEDLLYHVTYDKNDTIATGTAPVDSTGYIYGYNVAIQGQGSMAKAFYTFDGWNTKSDGTGTSYAGNSVMLAPGITEDMILYAQWKQNPLKNYNITYNANGGTFTGGSTQVVDTFTEGTAFNLLSGTSLPTRTDYTFVGWSTLPSGYTLYPAGTAMTASGNMTFYAIWESKIKITVVYHLNGYVNGSVSDIIDYPENNTNYIVRVGNGYTLKSPDNRAVNAWNTEENGNGTQYKFSERIAFSETGNKVVHLYPVVAQITKKVTFTGYAKYMKDRQKVISPQQCVVGSEITLPIIDADDITGSYTFAGWSYTDPDTKTVKVIKYDSKTGWSSNVTMPDSALKFTAIFV